MHFCILDISTVPSKQTQAPGGLGPALFLMLGCLMAIWSHLLRYWFPAGVLHIASSPIYFLSGSGFLTILVGSLRPSQFLFILCQPKTNNICMLRWIVETFLSSQWALAVSNWDIGVALKDLEGCGRRGTARLLEGLIGHLPQLHWLTADLVSLGCYGRNILFPSSRAGTLKTVGYSKWQSGSRYQTD